MTHSNIRLRTWDDVDSFEDLVDPDSKIIVTNLEARSQGEANCPYFRKLTPSFFYCGARNPRMHDASEKPTWDHPAYQAQLDVTQQQLYCRDVERFFICINYIHVSDEKDA